VRRQVEKALAAGDQGLLSSATLFGKSVALQGFSALELLLYGGDAQKTLASDAVGRLRCGYAQAIAGNIARIAADIDTAWRDEKGYSALMLSPGAENPAYLEAEEVTLEIVKSFLEGIEHVRDVEVAGPLGLVAHDKAPTTAVFETSGLTLSFIAANINGLIDLYRTGGIQAIATKSDDLLAAEVVDELATAGKAAGTLGASFAEVRKSASARRQLIAMGFPLRNARDTAFELVQSATGLSLGFRAGDGD
jgi:predicted lipoprotein